jgi:hypothetical protein
MIKSGIYSAQTVGRIYLKDGAYLCIWTGNSISFTRRGNRISIVVNRISPNSKPVESTLIVQNKHGLVLFEVLKA